MGRVGLVERNSHESMVSVRVDLDGSGSVDVSTGIGFYDHMLAQLGKHGGFDLRVHTTGDLEVDAHHTVEDTALALGTAFAEALGDKAGVTRYGNAQVPLDEVLASAVVDLSGRPYMVHDEPAGIASHIGGNYPTSLTRHIWESFAHSARVTLHVSILRAGRHGAQPDAHHIVEAQFKAVARALRQACALDPRNAGVVPSTKGAL